MDVAYSWEKVHGSPGKKKIWKVQESPELNIAPSYSHSALKNMKKVSMCMWGGRYTRVCAHVGLCRSLCLRQVLMSQSLTWSGFPAFSFLLRLEHVGGSREEKGNYAQWVECKLSIFHKKAVGPPRDICGQKSGFSHKMYFSLSEKEE